MNYDIIIIGGGASGFFTAISIKERLPNASVIIVEKTTKLLSKVKVSGGGRCNVTHHCLDNNKLIENYPRGNANLLPVFEKFGVKETINWFSKKGVKLKVEADGRMFPESNQSQTIIDCFLTESKKHGIEIKTSVAITNIMKENDIFILQTVDNQYKAKTIVVATGGNAKPDGYNFLTNLGLSINNPIPSLFTFNDKNLHFKSLAGVSVQHAKISIKSSDYFFEGPVLITHWGLSGPAILKLSAFAAEYLFDKKYIFTVNICWNNTFDHNGYLNEIQIFKEKFPKKNIQSNPLFDIPKRLWEFLCQYSEIESIRNWSEIGNKKLQKLIENLTACEFQIEGKTTFKEEFVTCGGVSLSQLHNNSLEHKTINRLFFCGEVLNIDGITGGFNFQSAWSTAWLVAQNIKV